MVDKKRKKNLVGKHLVGNGAQTVKGREALILKGATGRRWE